MNRGDQIKTLSYSFVELQACSSAILNYYDFVSYSSRRKEIRMAGHLSKSFTACRVDNDFLSSNNYLRRPDFDGLKQRRKCLVVPILK